jgi:hypothetical protein
MVLTRKPEGGTTCFTETLTEMYAFQASVFLVIFNEKE